ncbi:ATP diphosphatase [Thiothrix caldifontis]|uniref:Nucleoside triphosphate pyrophosphohydrolase n=1 Tax=Thiothrix caldifontis TaxID=525918 RepID=A0A1H3XHB6_9GAMM|nr:nucleoside triphosphate pyrophosphohydrolase [Thiothrix caldifontis]SDZ98787.1 ATP diphosphatase [Thiothrix caldifontis]
MFERSIYTTIVYIARQTHDTPQVNAMQGKNGLSHKPIDELLNIMRRLRDPQQGCPWDIKQTWQTILPYTLEEVYEVADAVDKQDPDALCDELGDLLFQVVFMAQIASEQSLFDFHDVAAGISRKMIRRHPHVFGDTVYADEHAQKQAWDAIKQAERGIQSTETGFFAGIPTAMPALRRSQKLQRRAASVGFDWDHWQQVIPKIYEELDEVIDAVAKQEPFVRIEEEVGDVLMGATNLARLLGVNAENALRLSNRKFERRFERVEALLAAAGIALDTASLEQMEKAWNIAKQEEKTTNGI